jgi:hypothetical protein
MADIKKLRSIARKLQKLTARYSRLEWVQYTAGYDFGIQKAYQKLVRVMKDQDNFRAIEDCRKAGLEPAEQRQADIMHLAFRPYHLSDELNRLDLEIQKLTTKLSGLLNTHRSAIDGREVRSTEISQILSEDPDREKRRQAYLARAQVNRPLAEGGFIELVALRREYARLYGAEDYAACRLEQQELEPGLFRSWPAEAARLLPDINRVRAEYGREYLEDPEVMPWDEAYISARLAPELNRRVDMSQYHGRLQEFFSRLGFDLSRYNITYDIFPRRNKSEWGYSFDIETAKDSRILANVENRYHEYGVLLHETGHALHSSLLKPREAILNLGVSGIISEGLANLFGDFLYHPAFFSGLFPAQDDETGRHFQALRRWDRASRIGALPGILFDQALYRDKIGSLDDIHQLYWKIYREILGRQPYAEQPAWGFRIHHTTHPIYLHNYFMGDLAGDMLKAAFLKRSGAADVMDRPGDFGKFLLREVIAPSGAYTFTQLYRRISGEDFSLKYLS